MKLYEVTVRFTQCSALYYVNAANKEDAIITLGREVHLHNAEIKHVRKVKNHVVMLRKYLEEGIFDE